MKCRAIHLATILSLSFAFCISLFAQVTPSGDAYINTSSPGSNYGSATTLSVVSPSDTTFIAFDFSSIPSGYTGADVAKATLKLYVNGVTTAGSFNVDFVNGSWSESTLTANNAPALGTTIAASVPLAKSQVHDFVLIDVTSAVQAWLNGAEANDGIALVPNSPFSATFDSKESSTQSHPAELDLVFAGSGGGTITGVLTAPGSGLSGGGTSGTLNLGLTTACASNQVLLWNGSAWTCANAGTGTITGVIAGTDLTGGGSGGNVTLNLDTTKVPLLGAANSFVGSQTVTASSGNGLGATTSSATGSGLYGANIASSGNANGVYGISSSPAGSGAVGVNTANSGAAYGVYGQSASPTGHGVTGVATSTNGASFGVAGTSASASGAGIYGTNSGGGLAAEFAGPVAVSGNLTSSGIVTATFASATSGFNLGGSLFAWGSVVSQNAFIGFAGNPATLTTGSQNMASGYLALAANTSGDGNTANGIGVLSSNTTGNLNAATGFNALQGNTTGGSNTAMGIGSLLHNTTGSNNTGLGANAGPDASTPALVNSTAVGAMTDVAASNALVLGSIKGLNGASSSVSVGIGTNAPAATLDVRDNGAGGNTISAISPTVGNSAVYGSNTATSGNSNGAYFITASPSGTAVVGVNTATSGNDYAGYFQGNVHVTGNLSKGGGSFKIDHPLDPANKYLYHSFVESPDMMNIYNGVVALDAHGSAWITMPEYFEALNRDFRYQLTSMGKPQPNLYVARELAGNRFRISGGKPQGRVSWQLTGIRHDAYANANRIPVEENKPREERGHYLHPELFGAPAEMALGHHAPAAGANVASNQSAMSEAVPVR